MGGSIKKQIGNVFCQAKEVRKRKKERNSFFVFHTPRKQNKLGVDALQKAKL